MAGMDAGPTNVLVADAQPLFSGALAAALAKVAGLSVIDERPSSAEDAVSAAERLKPDVVVCDAWLQGAETTRRILAAVPGCKVILLSWLSSPGRMSEALEAGAAAYLPQSIGLAEMAKAIQTARKGVSLAFAPELARMHETMVKRSAQTRMWGRKFENLSPRQQQILRMLGTGRLIQEIAKELSISPATVKWHIGRILSETGTGSQAEILAVARYAGFIRT